MLRWRCELMQLASWLTTWWNSGSIGYWLSHFVACLLMGCVVKACIQTRFVARLGPTWPGKQFTPCCLPLPLAMLIGSRTLSHWQSLPGTEPKSSALVELRGRRPYLAMSVTYVGALGGSIALGRSSPKRENGCACAALTRLTAMPSSHSRSQFIAPRVLLN